MATTVREPADRTASSRRCYAAAYARRRRKLLAYGQWTPLVLTDPGPARDHLAALRRYGLSVEAIADLSGQSTSQLAALLYPAHHRWNTKITAEAANRILAVGFDLDAVPGNRRISSAGTLRRLQALAVLGWPLSVLATDLGVTVQAVAVLRRRPTVSAATARKVRDVYDARSMSTGPSQRTTAAALRAGWLPPLAWDDQHIDDPDAIPEPTNPTDATAPGVDVVAIARATTGEHLPLTPAERRQVAFTLARQGLSDPDIATRLGISARTVLRWRHAHGIPPAQDHPTLAGPT